MSSEVARDIRSPLPFDTLRQGRYHLLMSDADQAAVAIRDSEVYA